MILHMNCNQSILNLMIYSLLPLASFNSSVLQWGAPESSSEAWTPFPPAQHSTLGQWCRMSWWRTGGSSPWSVRAALVSGRLRLQIPAGRQSESPMRWTNWKPNWCQHGITSNTVCWQLGRVCGRQHVVLFVHLLVIVFALGISSWPSAISPALGWTVKSKTSFNKTSPVTVLGHSYLLNSEGKHDLKECVNYCSFLYTRLSIL